MGTQPPQRRRSSAQPSRRAPRSTTARVPATDPLEAALEAARGGHHARAIELAHGIVARPRLSAAEHMDALDLCVESRLAQGDAIGARDDAEAMKALADRSGRAEYQVRAQIAGARVDFGLGRADMSRLAFESAIALARRARYKHGVALGLLHLARAQTRMIR